MSQRSPGLHELPEVFRVTDAASVGITWKVLRRCLRHGLLTSPVRGVYVQSRPMVVGEGAVPEPSDGRALVEYSVRAKAALASHPGHVLSHRSAAMAYGWPVLVAVTTPVDLTGVEVLPRSERLTGITLHHCDSQVTDVVDINGLRATAPARTVADCLRSFPLARGVAVADAAVRSGLVTQGEIAKAVAGQKRWRGRPRAVSALALIDPRRESWLESVSFVELHDVGIDLPMCQVAVHDEARRFVARVDGLWLAEGTVGEADGRGKYLKLGPDDLPGSLTARAVLAEKRREDRLRALGLEVVRWDHDEIVTDLLGVAARIRRAHARGGIGRFTGHLRLDDQWLPLPPHRTPPIARFGPA